MIRRHHLIEEAKTELDVAYEEVKRAETNIMALEQEYNERITVLSGHNGASSEAIRSLAVEKESRQELHDIEALYRLQGSAVERFALISSAFTIVGSIEDVAISVDLLKNILFRKDEIGANKIEIDRTLRKFSGGLKAYTREESNSENDRKVRQSWTTIETMLRDFGRDI